jgi:glycosyltransferase involved in cell wall biosynthesis
MALTVLMPVRDAPVDMLSIAIHSILTQTFADFEFLIVDDGSRKEEVRACLAQWAAKDARMRISWERRRGVTAALNAGLRQARGRFIARQDADDWSEPARLERQVEFLRSHPDTALCGTAAWTHQRDGTRLWRSRPPCSDAEIRRSLHRGNPFVHGSVMFSRSAAMELGGYREILPCSQDYDLFWRLAESFDVANLPDALYHYRYTGASISVERALDQARAHAVVKCLAMQRSRGGPEDVAVAFAAESGGEFRALLKRADYLMLAGEYRLAYRAFCEALRNDPLSPLGWAKFVRYGNFVAMPPFREVCFR